MRLVMTAAVIGVLATAGWMARPDCLPKRDVRSVQLGPYILGVAQNESAHFLGTGGIIVAWAKAPADTKVWNTVSLDLPACRRQGSFGTPQLLVGERVHH